MREIKFRAWIPEFNLLRDVINFDFDEPDDVYTRLPQVKIWNHASTRAAKIKGHVLTCFKKDVILMQYTGLKDKKGKEIYEGDILQWTQPDYTSQNLEKVIWHEAGWWIAGLIITDLLIPLRADEGIYRTVIGNIYENPELLKDKNE